MNGLEARQIQCSSMLYSLAEESPLHFSIKEMGQILDLQKKEQHQLNVDDMFRIEKLYQKITGVELEEAWEEK